MEEIDQEKYITISREIRRRILEISYRTRSSHIGSSMSTIEILVALYFRVLNVDPANPKDPDRDRFILSKGHASLALYSILAKKGFISEKCLSGFAVNGGTLEHHPNKDLSKGIETSTGSLGHGLPTGVGMALAAKHDERNHKIYALLSDGELNEGSTWEAIMFASHHKLDNLVAVIDYNKLQALGYTNDIINLEPLSQRWTSFGWAVKEIDGHDFQQLFEAFESLPFTENQPSVIIAHTIKGKGISFMENKLLWHYRVPSNEDYEKGLKELSK
ncbi:transketolase [Candidatus Pacearchaeota archaeon]|nr:transketolase [Candidatus Pacearchaeota archaeon]